jgi:hypothetical protein
MATKKPNKPDKPAKPKAPKDKKSIRTQMMGEHGDDDLGYDPSIIKTEPIPD